MLISIKNQSLAGFPSRAASNACEHDKKIKPEVHYFCKAKMVGRCPFARRTTFEDEQIKKSDEAHHFCEAKMVGRGGLEPPTSRLSGVRSNHLSYRPQSALIGSAQPRIRLNEPLLKSVHWTDFPANAGRIAGGAGRDRTDDPLLAKQVLSQLSYGP